MHFAFALAHYALLKSEYSRFVFVAFVCLLFYPTQGRLLIEILNWRRTIIKPFLSPTLRRIVAVVFVMRPLSCGLLATLREALTHR